MKYLSAKIVVIVFAMLLGGAVYAGYGQSKTGDNGSAAAAAAPVPVPAPAPVPVSPVPSPSPSPAYIPSPEQSKDLEIAQLKAQLAQSQYAAKAQALPEFAAFSQSVGALQQTCAAIKAANKWPEQVQCDMQQAPVRFCMGALPCTGAGVGVGVGVGVGASALQAPSALAPSAPAQSPAKKR